MHHKKLQLLHPAALIMWQHQVFDVPLTGAFTDVTTDHEECFYTMVVVVQNMAA